MSLEITSEEIRKLKDEELADLMFQYKPTARPHVLAVRELARRQNLPNEVRGWIALGLSIVAILVSIFSLLKKV